MVREIMRDQIFLSQKLEEVKKDEDYKGIVQDLKDTLAAHTERCVGMTANMIGVKKQVIIVSIGFAPMILINPKIVKRSGRYETEEGCLSLMGVRKCVRFKNITVEYFDEN
ncbi:MAG: peptide deformylase, partial [Lachnospiraceae bacterium]|nr:peptide deformylase [Lachnospiraceae bacterium]